LSHTHSDTPEDDEGNDASSEAGEQGSSAEDQCADNDHLTAAQSVSIETCKRHNDSVEYIEQGGNKSHCTVAGSEQCLNLRQDYVECLSVSLVQEKRNPKKDHDFPFVKRFVGVW
jgi:hypothetical protein